MTPPTSSLSFSCALITGGAGGIGKAIATSLIARGKTVLLAGRSEDTLRATAAEIGAAGWYVLDTGRVSTIPAFLDRVLAEHPELDCLINNAGVQRPFQVLGPDYAFDLASADEEIDINVRGPMHLSVQLIQRHFARARGDKGGEGAKGAVIMNVSSVLGFNPFSVINPVYNGTKAWLHMFTTNLRTQLKASGASGASAEGDETHAGDQTASASKSNIDTTSPGSLGTLNGSHIKIIEIVPPSVETDLHRDRTDPDDNKKHKGSNAMSVDEFMREVEAAWERGDETIAPGLAREQVDAWEESMGERYRKMT